MRAAVCIVAGWLVACEAPLDPVIGDAGKDAPIDARGGPMWIDASTGDGGAVDCKPRVTTFGDGHHNSGKDCQPGCHNHGFTISGTVYTGAFNNAAYSGATVTILMNNNQTIDLVTGANGNFYTSQAIAYPILVRVSACPQAATMQAQVAGPNGGRCNMAGCHAQIGGAQIHLP